MAGLPRPRQDQRFGDLMRAAQTGNRAAYDILLREIIPVVRDLGRVAVGPEERDRLRELQSVRRPWCSARFRDEKAMVPHINGGAQPMPVAFDDVELAAWHP